MGSLPVRYTRLSWRSLLWFPSLLIVVGHFIYSWNIWLYTQYNLCNLLITVLFLINKETNFCQYITNRCYGSCLTAAATTPNIYLYHQKKGSIPKQEAHPKHPQALRFYQVSFRMHADYHRTKDLYTGYLLWMNYQQKVQFCLESQWNSQPCYWCPVLKDWKCCIYLSSFIDKTSALQPRAEIIAWGCWLTSTG